MLYIKGCVIESNTLDSDNDCLTKQEIKEIHLNQRELLFDKQHECKALEGVRLVEEYITDEPTVIANQEITEGSWCVIAEVDNSELESEIQQKQLKGFSLYSQASAETYNDVEDKTTIQPLFLSFVENPANRLDFEVMSYDNYISKSESVKMTEETILDKLKAIIKSAEEEGEQAEEEVASEEVDKEEEDVTADENANEEEVSKDDDSSESDDAGEDASESEPSEAEDEANNEKVEKEEVEEEPTAPTVDLTEINEKLDTIIEYIVQKEEADKQEEAVEDDAEDEENYILKQVTAKESNVVKNETKTEPAFNLFGVKK